MPRGWTSCGSRMTQRQLQSADVLAADLAVVEITKLRDEIISLNIRLLEWQESYRHAIYVNGTRDG